MGQYILTDTEVAAIWPSGFSSSLVTLTLGSTDAPVTFSLYPIALVPLGLDRSAVVAPGDSAGIYLLVLVDYRYFLQTKEPSWTITDGTTTWANLDTSLGTFFSSGYSGDAVASAYLKPSGNLAPPSQASSGVIPWAGPLLDQIGEASGRRFVAGLTGTYTMQGLASAQTANVANVTNVTNVAYRHPDGGLMAFPPATESTTGLFTVPASIANVYPEATAGVEGTPYTVTTTFSAVRSSAGYATGDIALTEGTLAVGMGLWSDTTNHADLNAHGLQWATDWYGFLRGQSVQTYSGVIAWTPSAFDDLVTWTVASDVVSTRVEMGPINQRPAGVIQGRSTVAPVGPVFPTGATFYGTVNFLNGTINVTNEVVNLSSNSTINNASTNIFTGPQYYPIYDFSGSPLTINTVDWVIPAGNVRIKIASNAEYIFLGGIIPGTNPSGRLLYIYNVGNYTILIPNEYAGEATASRRILTTDGNFYFLAPTDCVCLCYDNGSQRWRVSENSHKRLSEVHTYTQWTTDQDNVALLPEVELHKISSNREVQFTGITNGLDTLRHRIMNDGFFPIDVIHNASTSTAGNRFALADFATSMTLYPQQEMIVEYDITGPGGATDGCWRVVGLFFNPEPAVEPTLVSNACITVTSGQITANNGLTLNSATWNDIPGTTFTFNVSKADTYHVQAVFDFNGLGTANVVIDPITGGVLDFYEGALVIDGSRQTLLAQFAPAHPFQRLTIPQQWQVNLGVGSHTLKLQAHRLSGSGTSATDLNTNYIFRSLGVLTVESKEISIPGGTVGAATCVDDPATCCGGSGSGSGSGSGGGGGIVTACCPSNTIPTTLYAHFSGGTFGCSCLNGASIQLTNLVGTSSWSNTLATLCSIANTTVTVQCNTGSGQWQLSVIGTGGACVALATPQTSQVCATPSIVFTGISVSGCCSGTVNVTVNATP